MSILEMLYFGYYNELSIKELEYVSENTKYRFEINDGKIIGLVK